MPLLVIMWAIVIFCLEVGSSFNQPKLHSIQNTFAHTVTIHRKYVHVTLGADPAFKQGGGLYQSKVGVHIKHTMTKELWGLSGKKINFC